MGSFVSRAFFPKDSWPSKDSYGRWRLYSLGVDRVRPGVASITVKTGNCISFIDFVEYPRVEDLIKLISPPNASEEWKTYLDECITAGQDPLNTFPIVPLGNKTYQVTLRRVGKNIYLADSYSPIDVQHYMQCKQTEAGLHVPDGWRSSFVDDATICTVAVTVTVRPSIERCSDWYRIIRLNMLGDVPRKLTRSMGKPASYCPA